MTRSTSFVILVGMAAAVGAAVVAAETAKLLHVPNPLSSENPVHRLKPRALPAVGKAFRDAAFGTRLMRVTAAGTLRHEYSRYDPFNADKSMIVLHDIGSGDSYVYRTGAAPYDRKANRIMTLPMEQPRWDPKDRNRLWGLRDLQILAVDIGAKKTSVVKDFRNDPTIGPILKAESDLYRVTTRDEGEASRHMRYWALILQGTKDDYRHRYVFTWDRMADKVLGVLKLPADEAVDWVGMSWSGKWVLIGSDPSEDKLGGLVMADLALKRFHQLDNNTAHSDVGVDVNGNDVIVMQNTRTDHIDLVPLDRKTRPTPEEGDRPYEGTNRTPLVRLFYSSESPHGLNSGMHISCNVPGYCVISTYMEPNVPERNWLDRCIILVRLDPAAPQAAYLAKVNGTRGKYWEETHATITNDGSRVIWATNWNRDVGDERPFLMQLDLPSDWRKQMARRR